MGTSVSPAFPGAWAWRRGVLALRPAGSDQGQGWERGGGLPAPPSAAAGEGALKANLSA